MKNRMDGFKNQLEAIKHYQKDYLNTGLMPTPSGGATVKTCPGIVDLLKTAYLIKAPADMVITVESTGRYCHNSSDPSIINITPHDPAQYFQEDNKLFDGKIALKFDIGVKIKTTGFGYIITDPTYHSNSGCFVPTGVMSSQYAKSTELNVIAMIDIPEGDDKVISIKAGDVLAYLIPFEKCGMDYTEENFPAKGLFSSFQARFSKRDNTN